MSGPHTEDLAFKLWKDAYADGFADGWDRGLDRAMTLLRNRVSADVLAELVALSASPPAATKYPEVPRADR